LSIHFDPTNLLSPMVGSKHGLSPAEVKAESSTVTEALGRFRKAVEGGQYGFPHLPFQTTDHRAFARYAGEMAGTFDTVCVAGIGGSALGAWALDCALRGPHPIQPAFSTKNPRLVILDNVDPSFVLGALESMNPRKTLVAVIAKSGATAETVATFLVLREWLAKALGAKANSRVVVVTTLGEGDLYALASRDGYRCFGLPKNVGGRFSVLSAVGLVPAALCGMNIGAICRGAAEMTTQCWKPDLATNPALNSALHHWLIWTRRNKPIQVAFPYANRLWGAAFWFRQLWAESLGKKFNRAGEVVHMGQTPVAALGTTDQHSQVQLYREGPNDKVFSFWTVRKFAKPGRIPRTKTGLEAMDYLPGTTLETLLDAEQQATAAALTEAERPNSTFALDRLDAYHIGAFLQLLEFETAITGELLGLDAFDQPGVELGKRFTFALMGRQGFDDYASRLNDYSAKRARVSE
jgi:glucose-6-phosphate isomerase